MNATVAALCRENAENRIPEAMFTLGMMLLTGEGAPYIALNTAKVVKGGWTTTLTTTWTTTTPGPLDQHLGTHTTITITTAAAAAAAKCNPQGRWVAQSRCKGRVFVPGHGGVDPR